MPEPRKVSPHLATRVATIVYGKKRVHISDPESYPLVFFGTAKRFNYRTHSIDYDALLFRSIDQCRDTILPFIEKTELTDAFAMKLFINGGSTLTGLLWAGPADWCEIFVEVTEDA